MNLVTPKAPAKLEPLLNKPASDVSKAKGTFGISTIAYIFQRGLILGVISTKMSNLNI